MEFVFVVPRRELFPDHYPQGFTPFGEQCSSERVFDAIERSGFFVERARAETTPEWKQVIPYNVVAVDGDVLLLKRTSRGVEARLHEKLSIGVGGHLNPEDLDDSRGERNPVPRGTRRELAEELEILGDYEVEALGTINDDANPVGAVHVGLVQIVRVHGSVEIREKHLLEGRLVCPAELRERLAQGANFETWSARLVEALPALLPHLFPTPYPEQAPVVALQRPSTGVSA